MAEQTYGVVVVSWNVQAELRRCLTALGRERRAGSTFEVVVVDNNSKDDSVDTVRREFPWVRLFAQEKNLGFAQACAIGAAATTANLLVFLNPDTEVGEGFFSKLGSFFASHPRAGVVGGSITGEGGVQQPSVRGLPTFWPLLLDELKLQQRFPGLVRRYLCVGFDYGASQPVEQVMGACFAVPRPAWEALGGFDVSFFMWFEEVDFCARARSAGYEVWYEAALRLSHVRGASARQLSYFQRHYLYTQSLVRYAAKHHGKVASSVLTWCSIPGFIAASLADYVRTATRAKCS